MKDLPTKQNLSAERVGQVPGRLSVVDAARAVMRPAHLLLWVLTAICIYTATLASAPPNGVFGLIAFAAAFAFSAAGMTMTSLARFGFRRSKHEHELDSLSSPGVRASMWLAHLFMPIAWYGTALLWHDSVAAAVLWSVAWALWACIHAWGVYFQIPKLKRLVKQERLSAHIAAHERVNSHRSKW